MKNRGQPERKRGDNDAINKFLIGFIDLKLTKKMSKALYKKAALSNRRVSNMRGLS